MTEGLNRQTKTAKDLLAMMQPTEERDIIEEIDGKEFAYKNESRCKVCHADDPTRDLPNGRRVKEVIDMMLMYPKSYAEIERFITPMMENWPEKERIHYQSIRLHQKRHLPFDKMAIREIVERRAQEKGKAILEGKERLLTGEAMYETIVQKTWQQLVEDTLQPNLREGMEAMQRLRELEEAGSEQMSTAQMLTELEFIIQAVRAVVPASYWPQIQQFMDEAKQGALPSSPAEDVGNDSSYDAMVAEVEQESRS